MRDELNEICQSDLRRYVDSLESMVSSKRERICVICDAIKDIARHWDEGLYFEGDRLKLEALEKKLQETIDDMMKVERMLSSGLVLQETLVPSLFAQRAHVSSFVKQLKDLRHQRDQLSRPPLRREEWGTL